MNTSRSPPSPICNANILLQHWYFHRLRMVRNSSPLFYIICYISTISASYQRLYDRLSPNGNHISNFLSIFEIFFPASIKSPISLSALHGFCRPRMLSRLHWQGAEGVLFFPLAFLVDSTYTAEKLVRVWWRWASSHCP